MRLKENLNIRKIGNDYFIVSGSDAGLDYTRVVTLNPSAFYLINEVQSKEFTQDDWVALLLDKYEVDREQAESDVAQLVQTLTKAGVIL